jgi:hypothetical protein
MWIWRPSGGLGVLRDLGTHPGSVSNSYIFRVRHYPVCQMREIAAMSKRTYLTAISRSLRANLSRFRKPGQGTRNHSAGDNSSTHLGVRIPVSIGIASSSWHPLTGTSQGLARKDFWLGSNLRHWHPFGLKSTSIAESGDLAVKTVNLRARFNL